MMALMEDWALRTCCRLPISLFHFYFLIHPYSISWGQHIHEVAQRKLLQAEFLSKSWPFTLKSYINCKPFTLVFKNKLKRKPLNTKTKKGEYICFKEENEQIPSCLQQLPLWKVLTVWAAQWYRKVRVLSNNMHPEDWATLYQYEYNRAKQRDQVLRRIFTAFTVHHQYLKRSGKTKTEIKAAHK